MNRDSSAQSRPWVTISKPAQRSTYVLSTVQTGWKRWGASVAVGRKALCNIAAVSCKITEFVSKIASVAALRGRMSLVPAAVVALVCTHIGACITWSAAHERTDEVRKLLNSVHGGATVCAPKELAYAEMYADIARYEADRGDTMLADLHVQRSSDLTAEVWTLSRRPECETDIDFDGIVDSKDACPEDPEDYDGMEDSDGCPEDDSDGDGISDRRDACIREPEDFDGFEDDDGCPELDNDKDAILDTADQCPNQPEDRDGFQDEDGCPDPDNDGDGIADLQDKCPNEPEDFDGDDDADGCPDLYKNIVVMDNMIALKQKVFFATNKDTILPVSFEMLSEVADVLIRSPAMHVRIEGHTDSRGSDNSNLRLSQRRANSVRNFLVQRGVPVQRMDAVGYGEQMPIDDNGTDEGRANNRRVEFHIVSQ